MAQSPYQHDQSAAFIVSSTYKPDIAAFVAAAALVECALNLVVSTPAFCRHVLIHLAIALDVTGPCFPIND